MTSEFRIIDAPTDFAIPGSWRNDKPLPRRPLIPIIVLWHYSVFVILVTEFVLFGFDLRFVKVWYWLWLVFLHLMQHEFRGFGFGKNVVWRFKLLYGPLDSRQCWIAQLVLASCQREEFLRFFPSRISGVNHKFLPCISFLAQTYDQMAITFQIFWTFCKHQFITLKVVAIKLILGINCPFCR